MTSIERIARSAVVTGLLTLALAARAAVVADDARESRWADEVVPQIVVGDAVWLPTPQRARVLAIYAVPAGVAKGAVIVVHGLGVHPDWGLIGEIRAALVERGFATLSVQMPVLAADAPRDDYASLGPLAAARLDAAVGYLHANGQAHVAVLSHSAGASMVNEWMRSDPRVDAWVPVGMLVPFAARPRVPILDVVGQQDYSEALARVPPSSALPRDGCSAAVTIAGADHFMSGAVPRLLAPVTSFLERVFAGRCGGDQGAAPYSSARPRPAGATVHQPDQGARDRARNASTRR